MEKSNVNAIAFEADGKLEDASKETAYGLSRRLEAVRRKMRIDLACGDFDTERRMNAFKEVHAVRKEAVRMLR